MRLHAHTRSRTDMVTLMQAKNLVAQVGGECTQIGLHAAHVCSCLAPTANLKVNAASPGHVKTPVSGWAGALQDGVLMRRPSLQFNNFTGIRTLEEGAAVYVHLATLPDDGPSAWEAGVQTS